MTNTEMLLIKDISLHARTNAETHPRYWATLRDESRIREIKLKKKPKQLLWKSFPAYNFCC